MENHESISTEATPAKQFHVGDSDEEEDQTTKEPPAIKSENEALRLSEMLQEYSRYHGQEDLTLAISKATDPLQKMKFKKLNNQELMTIIVKISAFNSLDKDSFYDFYAQYTACFDHLLSFTVQYCFLISFCLYRACFTHLISPNLRCNLCL